MGRFFVFVFWGGKECGGICSWEKAKGGVGMGLGMRELDVQ